MDASSHPHRAPDLEEVYDPDVLARIDRVLAAGPAGDGDGAGEDGHAEAPVIPRYPVARRLGLGGAVLAGAMLGVAEVLEPERARQHVIEHVPDQLPADDQPVSYHHVPGHPRASRIVVRPWLYDRLHRTRR
jgi:hypothetical protein